MRRFRINAERKIAAVLAALLFLTGSALPVFAEGEDNPSETTVAAETVTADAAAETEATAEEPEVTGEEETAEETQTEEEEKAEEAEGEENAEGEEEEPTEDEVNGNTQKATDSPYYTTVYGSAAEKLATMKPEYSAGGYTIFVDDFSGEVGFYNEKTGEILFTNPYDVAGGPATVAVKNDLFSQIDIKFKDSEGNSYDYNSFSQASLKNQITVKPMKNGVRVEYSIGDEETRYLVPMLIEKSRFEELVQKNILENDPVDREKRWFQVNNKGIGAYYTLLDPTDPTKNSADIAEMQRKYPITRKMAVYVLDTSAGMRELKQLQAVIKAYDPNYTFAKLEEDHSMTGYVNTTKAPPLFKMALEYTIDENGLAVRLPASGIRYDEDEYQLLSLRLLPYLGAGSAAYKGYTFFPDGSGSLFRFEDLAGSQVTVTGKVYGRDYAYQDVGTERQEIIRMPVFGVVEDYIGLETKIDITEQTAEDGTVTKTAAATGGEQVSVKRGYVAYIEEGESLATITSSHGGIKHKYNSVYTEYSPRPTDSFNLADSISVGENSIWTVVSNRKYAGNYKLRIQMLTDDGKAKAAGLSDGEYYTASYVGMAKAYRDYLVKTGTLTELTEDDVKEDVPLYIESFGCIDETANVLGIEYIKKTPLTSFDDLKTMTEELNDNGITNINYRLTGFTNGGMSKPAAPTKAKFEDSVGGNSGFNDFNAFANERGVGVYPDFDFVYVKNDNMFDGYSASKHSTKSIDGRYTMKQVYYAALQQFSSSGLSCVSPTAFDELYGKVMSDYDKLDGSAISVSTLGSDLNSDFDKDSPSNREESKEATLDLLKDMYERYNGNVMADGGNVFTLKYVKHIINASLVNSNLNSESNMVPFLGMVLHGYRSFAGTPTNMSSDISYETLKMLESGAAPYFTLSYENTKLLKEDSKLSSYYSVQYDIWLDELVERYNTINGALKDLQTSKIVNHEFLIGERIPDAHELELEAEASKESGTTASDETIEVDPNAAPAAETTEETAKTEETETADTAENTGTTESSSTETAAPAPAASGESGAIIKGTPIVETIYAPDTYHYTRYTVSDGSIVKVEYDNGTTFIINFNRFKVSVEGREIDALGFIKI